MLATNTPPPMTTIGARYRVLGQLGEGGMGSVHRALDRLSGQQVALKKVSRPIEKLQWTSRSEGMDLKLALAYEFQSLASLRHPNIISVLDYGFDAQLLSPLLSSGGYFVAMLVPAWALWYCADYFARRMVVDDPAPVTTESWNAETCLSVACVAIGVYVVTQALHDLMQANDIHYVFLGRRGGAISAKSLADSPLFTLIYERDGVRIFEIDDPEGVSTN